MALKWTMKNFYDIAPGEVFWAASDVGWVVGHSYIVYAPLLHGCTTVVFEGKPVSYTHLTLPTTLPRCRSRWSPYH